MKGKHSQWRKLDNAALAFPSVTGKNDTRVFRFYCQLKENVEGEILQTALERTMEKYPLFQAVLRKGLFWFYLERRELLAAVKEEERPPCSRLYIPDKKSLLFEVTYYKNRINFEVFHALTDGTGAMHFLEELVKNYLVLRHPEAELPELFEDERVTEKDLEEDSFSQYYSPDRPKAREKKVRAYQLPGGKNPPEDLQVTELALSVKETLAKAREYGVSITVFLAAVLLCSIREEIPENQLKKPVGLMIPVNLRNYFPSRSMANFFGWIEVSYQFERDTKFEDVLSSAKEQFKRELSEERIAARMNDLVRLEKNPLLRAVPLEIKSLFLQAGTSFGGRGITAVYSNVGVIKMPAEYEKYIEQFGFFASTNTLQLCSCSYGDKLILGFTHKITAGSIERNFVDRLRRNDLSCRLEESRFPGARQSGEAPGKKLFETFTFLCIAIAVLSVMVDYMADKQINWSLFAGAGCLCTWVLVSMGYVKRRNPLKNAMWQLLLVNVLGILWDVFTGWRSWSIDYLLPLTALTAICSIAVIAAVRHLENAEYLFYLMQACAFGWIPLILVITGAVRVTYPSVICAGISFLVIVWLFLFRKRDAVEEIHKKFRM